MNYDFFNKWIIIKLIILIVKYFKLAYRSNLSYEFKSTGYKTLTNSSFDTLRISDLEKQIFLLKEENFELKLKLSDNQRINKELFNDLQNAEEDLIKLRKSQERFIDDMKMLEIDVNLIY